MARGRRVLFTGISGIHLGHGVEKLAKYVRGPSRIRRVKVLKAEQGFAEAVTATGLFHGVRPASAPEQTILSLRFPKPILRECWCTAFRTLAEKEGLADTDDDVLLHGHACFYHQQTREFFSLIDIDLVRKLLKPDLVITLIDDIEHIHQRLRQPGHMFEDLSYEYRGFAGFIQACHNLSVLMHWRASEFSESERIALALRCPHFLVAVKHPLGSVGNLIYERDYKKIYVSHPISEPRRFLAERETDKFDAFVRGLASTCRKLRDGAVLFEPTTIDEFRFRRFRTASRTVFLPSLTARWPHLAAPDELLWAQLKDPDVNPVDQYGYFAQEDLGRFEKLNRAKADVETEACNVREVPKVDGALREVEIASQMMGVLIGEIEDQVAARDLKLVEQSDHLLVIRPLYQGNPSRGVQEEIRFHCRLVARGSRPRGHLWVFTTEEDERLFKINRAVSWLVKLAHGQSELPLDRVEQQVAQLDLTRAAEELVPELLAMALKHGVRLAEPAPATLEGTARLAVADAMGALAPQLRRELTPPYERILEEESTLDAAIAHTVECGKDWPSQAFLERVLCTQRIEQAVTEDGGAS